MLRAVSNRKKTLYIDINTFFIFIIVPLGEGNDIPLQYSCLENPMIRGAWWARVHGVAKGWT